MIRDPAVQMRGGRSFHRPGTVNENVLESDFVPLCDGTTRRRSLAIQGFQLRPWYPEGDLGPLFDGAHVLCAGQREFGQYEEFGCPEAMLDIIHHRKNAINVLAYNGITPLWVLNVTDDRLNCYGSVW